MNTGDAGVVQSPTDCCSCIQVAFPQSILAVLKTILRNLKNVHTIWPGIPILRI